MPLVRTPPTLRPGGAVRLLIVFVLFVLTATVGQWYSGAFHAEFAGNPDEGAHVITGLMVRDYLANLAPESPMPYAENYYLHYPKVAFGHWPPFFYVVQAAWTLLIPPSRLSLMLLMAILTAALATGICYAVSREYEFAVGAVTGLLFLSLPMVREYSAMVMAEVLVALLVFCAALLYGQYLDNPRWQTAALFGVAASLAVLTKATGALLAFAPPCAVLISRRFELLRRFSFWLPAVIVAAVAIPWYSFVPGAFHQSADLGGSPIALVSPISHPTTYPMPIVSALGVVCSLSVLVGLLPHKPGSAERHGGARVAAAAVILGFGLFGIFVPPAREFRHTLNVVAPALLFLPVGLVRILDWQPLLRLSANRRAHVVAGIVIIFTLPNIQQTWQKPRRGFSEVAEYLLSHTEFQDSVALVCSDAAGEGALISEVAMREARPGHIILRASKMLASSSWFGRDYYLLFPTPAKVLEYLESVPVDLVVIDFSVTQPPEHYSLLAAAVRSSDWKLVSVSPREVPPTENRGQIQVYRRVGQEIRQSPQIRIEVTPRLEDVI